ncbi:MAG: magnesium transporter CorA family protein [Acidimicrobiia bacterium]
MTTAWRYVEGVADAEALDVAGVRDALDPTKGLIWVDCDDASGADKFAEQLGIDPLASKDIQHTGQRTKLESYRDHFHVAVHDCVFTDNHLATSEIDLVLGDGWLLSVRHPIEGGPPFPITEVRRRFENQRGERGSDDEGVLMWAMLDVIVDRYLDVAERVEERIAQLQDKVFGEQRHPQREIPQEIFFLDKTLLAFRQAALPLGEIVNANYVGFVNELARERLRDVSDHSRRINEQISAQQHLVDGLLSADLALRSYSTNEVMKRMTSWGAILLGATLIAGIYGMNFRRIPELDWYLGYPFALGTMLVLTVTLYVWFKQRGWL